MLTHLVVWLRRLILFLPGLIVAILIYIFFPDINKPIPLSFAVIITYCLAAYIAIPFLMRLIRFIYKPKHIPLYSLTPDGQPCDPINLCIVGTKAEVKKAMQEAGWHAADKKGFKSTIKMAYAVLLKRQYKTAPFSSLYLFGRKQDFGFQIPVGTSPFKRHHVRFWEVDHRDAEHAKEDIDFWRSLSTKPRSKIPALWLGAATFDRGLGVAIHTGQIDHFIHGDTNAERNFVVETLKATGLVASTKKLRAGQPYTLRNRILGIRVMADGEIILVNLRRLGSPLAAIKKN